MKVLVLGGDGMFGHQMVRHLRPNHDVRVTLRHPFEAYEAMGLFRRHETYDRVDAQQMETVEAAVHSFEPEAVVNAIGIIKQLPSAHQSIPTLEVNALFPHRLAALTRDVGARLVHLSTDCVFSGQTGQYTEAATPDATDLYGRTKTLGEVSGAGVLTLRKSLIGHELHRKVGLLEWALAQRGEVRGFRRAIFSGLSTVELARVIERLLTCYPEASGLYHVSSSPINKYDLLKLISQIYKLPVEIIPDDNLQIDRSLDSSLFRAEFEYTPPTWAEMVDELAECQRINLSK